MFSLVFVGGGIYCRKNEGCGSQSCPFSNHQAHFFGMVGCICATCKLGLHCIGGVALGIKAWEGGGASLQPITVAVVRRASHARLPTTNHIFPLSNSQQAHNWVHILHFRSLEGDGSRGGGGGGGVLHKLYTYTMTSRVCIHGWLGSCFCLEWREGEKIAHCSTNSITLESPHHLFCGEQKAP